MSVYYSDSQLNSVNDFARNVILEKHKIEKGPDAAIPVMIDPATIALIASITIKLIQCLYKRYGNKAADIKENIDTPGMLDQIGLKRMVFAALGWRKYRKEGATVIEALLKTGSKLRIEDISTLITKGL